MKKLVAAAVTLTVLGSIAVSAPPALAASKVRITAAYYDPNPGGPDPDTNAGRNHEYIVIRNFRATKLALTGWVLHDVPRAGTVNRFVFPKFALGPGKVVRIHTGSGSNTRMDLYWGKTFYVWGDDSDTATLQNKARTVVDRCSWTSANTSPAYC